MNDELLKKFARPLIILATIIWGSSFVIMKGALDTMPIFYLLAFRFSVAAIFLAILFRKRWKLFSKKYLISGLVMGTLLFAAYAVQTYGLAETTPGKNAFLTSVYCVFVPFLYWIVSKQAPDKYNMSAALLCIMGVGFVSLTSDLTINRGDALTLVGGAIYACHIVAVARMSQGKDVFILTSTQFAVTAAWAWIFAAIFADFPSAAVFAENMGGLLYLTFAATAGALLFQNMGQKYTPPATAAVLLSLEAPFSILFSVLSGSEVLTGQICVGFAFIFVSIICSETKFSFLRKKAAALSHAASTPKK
ncbi:MAG: DMT family transporter [Pseudoflavonifractor sp.]